MENSIIRLYSIEEELYSDEYIAPRCYAMGDDVICINYVYSMTETNAGNIPHRLRDLILDKCYAIREKYGGEEGLDKITPYDDMWGNKCEFTFDIDHVAYENQIEMNKLEDKYKGFLTSVHTHWPSTPKGGECVYFVRPYDSSDTICKIGYTSNIVQRLKQLNTAIPSKYYVMLLLEPTEYAPYNARELEQKIHEVLRDFHVNGEFYDIPFGFLHDLRWDLFEGGDVNIVFLDEIFIADTIHNLLKKHDEKRFFMRESTCSRWELE